MRRIFHQRDQLVERVRPHAFAQIFFRLPFLGIANGAPFSHIGRHRTVDASPRRSRVRGHRMQCHGHRTGLSDWHEPFNGHPHTRRKHMTPGVKFPFPELECERLGLFSPTEQTPCHPFAWTPASGLARPYGPLMLTPATKPPHFGSTNLRPAGVAPKCRIRRAPGWTWPTCVVVLVLGLPLA